MKDKIVHCVDEPRVHSIAANIIEYFVNKGIHITIDKSEDYGIYYDLNTGMKSHAHMVFHANFIKIYMRYGEHNSVDITDKSSLDEVIEEICYIVKGCMYGRDFLNGAWEKLLIEKDILTKHV